MEQKAEMYTSETFKDQNKFLGLLGKIPPAQRPYWIRGMDIHYYDFLNIKCVRYPTTQTIG